MTIRCPAHQWLYGLDGKLHSAPRYGPGKADRADPFDWEKNGLKPVPGTVWLDLIFVNLGGKAAPLDVVGAGVRAALPNADEEVLTGSPLGSVQRTVQASLAEVVEAFGFSGGHGASAALDKDGMTRVMLAPNTIIGHAPGLFCSVVVEPHPRAGCMLAVRYYQAGAVPSGSRLRTWGRSLARTIAVVDRPRLAAAASRGVVPGRA